MIGNEVIFHIDKPPFLIHPLESVTAISVVKSPSLWSSVVTKEHQSGVIALRNICKKIKQAVIVNQEVCRVPLLRSNNIGPLNRVSAEENWPVQTNNIVVSVIGVHFNSKTTGVTPLIRELSSESHGGETNCYRCLPTSLLEEVCLKQESIYIRYIKYEA